MQWEVRCVSNERVGLSIEDQRMTSNLTQLLTESNQLKRNGSSKTDDIGNNTNLLSPKLTSYEQELSCFYIKRIMFLYSNMKVGEKVPITPTKNSQTPAGCPIIQLTSDIVYLGITSDSTG